MTEFDDVDGELEYGEEDTGFSINLYESADVGDENSYRLQNTPGENQRQHIIQQGKPTELIVQGDLYAVVHGTLTPRGKDATLIVLQFTFAGSEATKRRFKKIWIRVEFANWDEKIGGKHDPEVRAIAPEGEFRVGEGSSAEISTVLMAGVSAPVMQGIVELSASVERGKTTTRTSRATVYGGKLIAKRTYGKQNSVLWKLTEDDIGQTGVPRSMRSAILVVPQTNDGFELHVDIDATVDTRYVAETKTRRMMGKAKVDPVFFSDEKVNFGPKLKGVNPDNLGGVKLSELCLINTGISM